MTLALAPPGPARRPATRRPSERPAPATLFVPVPPQPGHVARPALAVREAWGLAAGVVVAALAFRLILGIALGPSVPVADDQREYLGIARELAVNGRFSQFTPGPATAFRDPAYPGFLAILLAAGAPLRGVWLAQSLMSAVTGALVVLAARRRMGRNAAWLTFGLFMLCADFAVYGVLAYSETLACFGMGFLLFGLADSIDRPGRAGPIAASLGGIVAVLTRTACAAGVLAVVVAAGRASDAARRAALPVLVSILLAIAAWSARNGVVMGTFAPNTNGAVNVYLGNNPRTPLVHGFRAMLDPLVWRPLRGLSEPAMVRRSLELTRDYVVHQPGRAALGMLGRVPDALELDRMLIGVGRHGQFPSRSPRTLLVLGMLMAALSTLPRVLGLAVVLSPGTSVLARVGRWAFLGFLATQLVSLSAPRLMLPGWILLLPGCAMLLVRLRAGETRARVALVASVLILAPVWLRQFVLG